MSRKKVAIGIDLGTSKCCVGAFRDSRVEILENERAYKTTPSYVAFTDTERLVGEDAKDQATLNPTNTVFGVKGIIGKGLEDLQVEKATKDMPYIIVDNAGDTCINVTYKGEEEALLPQQVTAMLLTKMKDLAQDRLECSVEEAVISVPASFSNAQRQATKDAATIAGLKVLALINEPTAAAVAYQANRKEEAEETIAVVDFGGGKLDVAIVTVKTTSVTVRGLSGTTDLGGNDVDEILMEHVQEVFKEKFSKDAPKEVAVVERLRVACAKLKHSLSLLPKVQDHLDCFGDEFLLQISISREKYEELISNKIQTCLSTHLARALHVSGVKKEQLSRVVLVGGSTRIPMVPQEIMNHLSSSKLDRSVNPDEAVAHGAAIYAALLSGDNTITELIVEDILSNSFCISLKGSQDVQKLMDSPMKIPSYLDLNFNERNWKQTFDFLEELSGRKDPHKHVGTFCLSQEFARAVCLVRRVVVEVDVCGTSDITVVLKGENVFRNVVNNYTGRLNEVNLQKAFEREKQFRIDDQNEKDRVLALTNLESICFSVQSDMASSKGNQYCPDLVKQLAIQASDAIEWLDTEKNVSKVDCIKRMKSLKAGNRSLQEKIRAHEKHLRERAEAEENLKSYCSSLETVLTQPDVTEDPEMATELNEQLRKTLEWLESVQNPSKEECDAKNIALQRMYKALSDRLEERQQEKERVAALGNLHQFCVTLQSTVVKDSTHEQDRELIGQLSDTTEVTIQWLNTATETRTKSDCEEKETALASLVGCIEKQQENRRAQLLEKERLESVKDLNIYSTDLLKAAVVIRTSHHDPSLVKLIDDEVKAARNLMMDNKTASKVECDNKKIVLESLRVKLDDSIKAFELKRQAEHDKQQEIERAKLQEEERMTSVKDLTVNCSKLWEAVNAIRTSHHDPSLAKLIDDEVKAARKMIGNGKTVSKEQCDEKGTVLLSLRGKLEDSIKLFEQKNMIAQLQEKERTACVKNLRANCTDLLEAVNRKKTSNRDPSLVKLIQDEVKAARKMIGDGKTVSKEQCDEKETLLVSLRGKLEDSIKVYEQERQAESEKQRVVALETFESRCASVEPVLFSDVAKTQNPELVDKINKLARVIQSWLKTTKTFSQEEYLSRIAPLEEAYKALQCNIERQAQLEEAQRESTREGRAESASTAANRNADGENSQHFGSDGDESNLNDQDGSKCADDSNNNPEGGAEGKSQANKNASKQAKRKTRTAIKAADSAKQTKMEDSDESDGPKPTSDAKAGYLPSCSLS